MASAKKLWLYSTPIPFSTGAPTVDLFSLNASGNKIAVAFQAKEAATITHLGYRYCVRTGTPPTYKISLQGLSAAGEPDGTVKGGGSPASGTFTPPANTSIDNTFIRKLLDNAYTVSRGEYLTWVVEYASGTVNGSNFSSFSCSVDPFLSTTDKNFPISLVNSGAWSKQASRAPLWGYKSSTNVYGFPYQDACPPVNIATTGNRIAAKFTLDSAWGDTFKIGAIQFILFPEGVGNIKFGIWNAAGTVIQDLTFDCGYLQTFNTWTQAKGIFDESSLTALTFGTTYYAGFEYVDQSFYYTGWQLASANDLKAFPGEGSFSRATWNGSAWTDDLTVLMPIAIYFDDLTEPAGGGGNIIIVED